MSSLEAAAAGLTRRQHQVLELWNQGRSIRGIGRLLGISPTTVHQHKRYGLKKVTRAQGFIEVGGSSERRRGPRKRRERKRWR